MVSSNSYIISDSFTLRVFILVPHTGVTVAVSLQGSNPVTEPGASTNLMLCASVSSSPGVIERDTVVRVNSTEGTAGTYSYSLLDDYTTTCQILISQT